MDDQLAGGRIALRPVEAAKLVGISRATFYLLLQSGEVPSRRCGGMRLVLVEDLREWVRSLPPG